MREHREHRRSLTGMSREGSSGDLRGAPSSQGIGLRAQSSSARVPQLSFQPLNVGNSNTYTGAQGDVASPHSQPLTPMHQQRTPILLHSAGLVSAHSSAGQDSPRALPAAALSKAESRTPLGINGLGFFSGAESQLWAPSPKSQVAQVPVGSQSTGSHTRHLDSFVFEESESVVVREQHPPPSQQQQQQLQQSLAAASWSGSTKLEEFDSESKRSAGAISGERIRTLAATSYHSPLLMMEKAGDGASSAPTSALPSEPSVSPDSLVPAKVVDTLWQSPPATMSLSDQQAIMHAASSPVCGGGAQAALVSQLAAHLQCPRSEPSSPAHRLRSPVSTMCCGLTICKPCVEPHLAACKSNLASQGAGDDAQNGRPAQGVEFVGVCSCGHSLRSDDEHQLRNAPVNRALEKIVEWMQQLEGGACGVGDGGGCCAGETIKVSSPPAAAGQTSSGQSAHEDAERKESETRE